jgi:hypothetical protein
MTIARGAIAVLVSLVTLALLTGQVFALSEAQFPPLEHAIIAAAGYARRYRRLFLPLSFGVGNSNGVSRLRDNAAH